MNHYYVLEVNLKKVKNSSKTIINYEIGILNENDIQKILNMINELDEDSIKELLSRLIFEKVGFNEPYIVHNHNNKIAYIQWLIYPHENNIINKHFSRKFYPLSENQVMVENAFTFPQFRGLGLMPAVTCDLLTIAKEAGYRSAICYIRKDRIAALNEFMKLGFKITKLTTEYKVFGFAWRTL